VKITVFILRWTPEAYILILLFMCFKGRFVEVLTELHIINYIISARM